MQHLKLIKAASLGQSSQLCTEERVHILPVINETYYYAANTYKWDTSRSHKLIGIAVTLYRYLQYGSTDTIWYFMSPTLQIRIILTRTWVRI